jgi:hypothetical protein
MIYSCLSRNDDIDDGDIDFEDDEDNEEEEGGNVGRYKSWLWGAYKIAQITTIVHIRKTAART